MEYPSDLQRNSRSCFAWLGRRSKKPHFLTFCFVVVTVQEPLYSSSDLGEERKWTALCLRSRVKELVLQCFLRERSFETSSDLKESHSLVSKAGW